MKNQQLNISSIPKWLMSLLTEKFYNACILHEAEIKNEKNIFCVDCCEAICPHCCFLHPSHRLLKIRRYVYHDVVRVSDGDKLIECKHVQTYTTNGAKVVFLNQRPQTGQLRGSSVVCVTCQRKVHYPFRFCSISCKIEHMLRTGGKLSSYLRKCDRLTIPEPGLDDGQMTPDSVLELSRSNKSESCSSTCLLADLLCPTLACTATTEIVKKKRSNLSGLRSSFRSNAKPVSDLPKTTTNCESRSPVPVRPVCGNEDGPALVDNVVLMNIGHGTPNKIVRGYEVQGHIDDTKEVLMNREKAIPKNRRVCGYEAEPCSEAMNRRKGAPRRAPLY